ncbi:hypothetical protein DTL42_17865 [Bremerella cremea]|uniref:Uncharacterized protein n=1 Tax=Bremerella cremea TaxID=1031537 RepID=A0A368KQ51_9BACT|nr:hypothetical protein [Bremerella cremea]RCS44178.1 hypothetical protein DTL42_17865 [Bremerella cremea]
MTKLFIVLQFAFLFFTLAIYGTTVVPGHPLERYRLAIFMSMTAVFVMLCVLWYLSGFHARIALLIVSPLMTIQAELLSPSAMAIAYSVEAIVLMCLAFFCVMRNVLSLSPGR